MLANKERRQGQEKDRAGEQVQGRRGQGPGTLPPRPCAAHALEQQLLFFFASGAASVTLIAVPLVGACGEQVMGQAAGHQRAVAQARQHRASAEQHVMLA